MKEFEKNSLIILFLTFITNIFSFLFQIIMGRMLDVSEFGTLNSISSFYSLVLLPVSIIFMVVSRHVTRYNIIGRSINVFLKKTLLFISIFAVFYTILGISLSNIIASYIKIQNINIIILLMLAVGLGLILPVATGGLQGGKKFIAFGMVNLIFWLTRLLASIIFVLFGLGIHGIILSYIIGNLLAIIIGFSVLKINFTGFYNNFHFNLNLKIFKYVWIAFMINIGMTFLTNIDIILVKHFFTDEITGLYSAASILGKAILIASSSVIFVMFPYAAEADIKKYNIKIIFNKTLLYSAALSLFCAIGLNIFAKQIITVFFGNKYMESIIYILPITIWIIAVSIIFVISNFLLAVNKADFFSYSLLFSCIICFFLVYFIHNKLNYIIYIFSSISYIILVINFISIRIKFKGWVFNEPAKQ